jgi:two-component system sensor histidine kinase KdpD
MLIVLSGAAIYTSAVTGRLRARVALSDRSAQENASLAAFGLDLTQASDWGTTANLVCNKASALFGVEAVLFREVRGELTVAGASGEQPKFTPLDRTALELAWNDGAQVGSGTHSLPDCDWQFRPLRTSLGVLAILAIAREDGRDPVPAQRRVLFETFLAQAALAHERLRLEDKRVEETAQE